MRSTGITVMVTVNLSMHCLSFVLVCTKKSCVMSNYIVTPRVCTTKVVSVNTITPNRRNRATVWIHNSTKRIA